MSDADFQRGNAHRHHREQDGQDRFGQKALQTGTQLYHVEKQKTQSGELYYYSQYKGGQWVNVKKLEHVRTENGRKLYRFK